MGTNPSCLILAVSDLANKNMEHSVKCEFQINNEPFFVRWMQYWVHTEIQSSLSLLYFIWRLHKGRVQSCVKLECKLSPKLEAALFS